MRPAAAKLPAPDGYTVVRRHWHECAHSEEIARRRQADGAHGLPAYRGADRDPFEDITRDHFAGRLDARSAALLEAIVEGLDSPLGVDHVTELAIASELLSYSADRDPSDEIIALYAAGTLAQLESAGHYPEGWLGLDVFERGEWSLLAAGLHQRPSLFADFVASINEHGLLGSIAAARAYRDHYHRVADDVLIEKTGRLGEVIVGIAAIESASIAPPSSATSSARG